LGYLLVSSIFRLGAALFCSLCVPVFFYIVLPVRSQVVLLLFVIYFSGVEVLQMVEDWENYFASALNWLEMLNLILFYVTFAYQLASVFALPETVYPNDLSFISKFRNSGQLKERFNDINAFNLFLAWVYAPNFLSSLV
jgi:hypothetical protein